MHVLLHPARANHAASTLLAGLALLTQGEILSGLPADGSVGLPGMNCSFAHGPNVLPAGKTTALGMLSGLTRPTGGDCTVQGHSMASSPALARQSLGFWCA